MLFTRTIRRTMVCGLAMVLVMMIGLSLSAIYSHLSYRRIIGELDYAFTECPRKGDLVEALVKLKMPLLIQERQSEFGTVLREARTEVKDFLHKLQRMPPYPEFQQSLPLAVPPASEIELTLTALERQQLMRDPAPQSQDSIATLCGQIDVLLIRAEQIPDFQRGIKATFADARTVFRRGFWLVVASGLVALLFFLSLIAYGYVWVFAPLRKLHQGALRVAQGDFNYRLELSRQDEMKELADAFNSMTSRFQEIAGDLDRQVCERIKQLIRSERLAGIGLLSAGVAHEINNPLSAIAMAAESLTDRVGNEAGAGGHDPQDAEITRQYLEMIQRESFRCQKITQKLLDFARGNGDTYARHDLAAVVSDVLGVVRHMSRYQDRTIRFARRTPCWLVINGPEIQQVILNLVSNALEAMDSGGVLSIDIQEQTDHVTLTLTDDGCGMSAEVIENLFEPFFTSRRNGRGTGLGLSISHRIVSDHGGAIEVESPGPARGSTFRVRLPKRPPSREVAA